jgi:3-methyladenine DNA glycosylase/8-oxoguanine DNA glycosylase
VISAGPLSTRVRPVLPTDLVGTLAPLQRAGRWDPSMRLAPGEVQRATRLRTGAVSTRWRQVGAEIEVEAWGEGAEQAIEEAPAVLGGADSLDGFAPAHPLVVELHRRNPGLRMSWTGTVFEALVPTVMEQKVIGLEARAGYRRLLMEMGEPAPGPLGLRLPPSAETLSRTPYWRLHAFAVERRRAETIIGTARRAGYVERAAELGGEAAQAHLRELPGIGTWTAALVAMLALGDADAVPVGDYNLPSTISYALAGEVRADDARMLELLEPFRGHRGRVIRLVMAGHIQAPRFGPRLALRHLERS